MATLIAALSAYRPRVVAKRTVDLDMLAQRMERGSLASPSIVRMVLTDLCEQIEQSLADGEAVSLPGIGRFSADVKLDGSMRPVLRAAPSLRNVVRHATGYRGTITNRESIGRSVEQLVARWNEEHPDDPVA
jgi:hypothetical protein